MFSRSIQPTFNVVPGLVALVVIGGLFTWGMFAVYPTISIFSLIAAGLAYAWHATRE